MKKFLRVVFTHIFLAAICLQLTGNGLYASFSKKDVGTTACQFLKLGAGSRATALGDAFVGIADDATSVYWNPAGLGKISRQAASVNHNVWFENMYYDWASYVHPLKDGAIGAGVQYFGYGELEGRDETGLATGDFKPRDMAVTVSYGREVAIAGSQLEIGASVKYISSKIQETAEGVAADIGGLYEFDGIPLTAGLVVQNLGTKIKYEDTEEKLPLNIKLGFGYKIIPAKGHKVLLAAEVDSPIDNEIKYGAGAEYRCEVTKEIALSCRAGYNSRMEVSGNLKGFTAGAGIEYGDYGVDYAFVPFGDLGDTHRVSLGVKF